MLDLLADTSAQRSLRRAAYLLVLAGQDAQAATLLGAIELDSFVWSGDLSPWMVEMIDRTRSVASDPRWETELRRGGRLGLLDAADAAIAWLSQAHPPVGAPAA